MNSEKDKASKRRWNSRNRGYIRAYHMMRSYGITPAIFDEMARAQDGRCLICNVVRKLCVDHCHATGIVRGLLCRTCNSMMGTVERDPGFVSRLASYADKAAKTRCGRG